MRQRSILWFLLSEAMSNEIRPNLLTPLLSQHQPSNFAGLSWGGLGLRRDSSFRGGGGGVLFNHAFVERDSGWRLSSFRGEGFGLS